MKLEASNSRLMACPSASVLRVTKSTEVAVFSAYWPLIGCNLENSAVATTVYVNRRDEHISVGESAERGTPQLTS